MIPALGELAQEYHHGFEDSLGYKVNSTIAWLTYRMKLYLKNLPLLKKTLWFPVSVTKSYREYYGLKCIPHET